MSGIIIMTMLYLLSVITSLSEQYIITKQLQKKIEQKGFKKTNIQESYSKSDLIKKIKTNFIPLINIFNNAFLLVNYYFDNEEMTNALLYNYLSNGIYEFDNMKYEKVIKDNKVTNETIENLNKQSRVVNNIENAFNKNEDVKKSNYLLNRRTSIIMQKAQLEEIKKLLISSYKKEEPYIKKYTL